MTEESLIKFPCDFDIKVFGLSTFDLETIANRVILKHSPHMKAPVKTKVNHSANNKYISITATIKATSQEQLDAIYQELHSHEATIMVL